mmetsp:Transcript_117833/g.293883  ORF Transcript_117833/g.293883 Transcript_117833/m.293883 type:complete len:285 (-) Transcript_117833:47-901(-)
MARTSTKRWAKRASESTLPKESAMQAGTIGTRSMHLSVTSVKRPSAIQCFGGASVGHTAIRMKVESKCIGLAGAPAPSAAVTATTLPVAAPLRRSNARHNKAPSDVVKTRACSRTNSPHHTAKQAHRPTQRSNLPASVADSPCCPAWEPAVAMAARTALIFARAASARAASPVAIAFSANLSNRSMMSSCRALFGYSDSGDNGALLSGSTGRRASHSAITARSYVWPLGATTGWSMMQCEIGQSKCCGRCSSKLMHSPKSVRPLRAMASSVGTVSQPRRKKSAC